MMEKSSSQHHLSPYIFDVPQTSKIPYALPGWDRVARCVLLSLFVFSVTSIYRPGLSRPAPVYLSATHTPYS